MADLDVLLGFYKIINMGKTMKPQINTLVTQYFMFYLFIYVFVCLCDGGSTFTTNILVV